MSLLSDFLGTEDFSLKDSPMFRKLIANIKNEPTVETISFDEYKMKILSQYDQIENIELGEKTSYKQDIIFTFNDGQILSTDLTFNFLIFKDNLLEKDSLTRIAEAMLKKHKELNEIKNSLQEVLPDGYNHYSLKQTKLYDNDLSLEFIHNKKIYIINMLNGYIVGFHSIHFVNGYEVRKHISNKFDSDVPENNNIQVVFKKLFEYINKDLELAKNSKLNIFGLKDSLS